ETGRGKRKRRRRQPRGPSNRPRPARRNTTGGAAPAAVARARLARPPPRQAACHPGLISPELATEASAKLEMLIPSISEVVEEGHKVLVFSQFTSFLA